MRGDEGGHCAEEELEDIDTSEDAGQPSVPHAAANKRLRETR